MWNQLRLPIRGAAALCLVAIYTTGCRTGPPPDPLPRGWPVAGGQGEVSARYGEQRGGRVHQGVDIRASRRTKVVATAPGRVSYVGRDGAYGKVIRVDHANGYQTVYAHLWSRSVRTGKRVSRGDVLGRVGRTGNATGYHLHYEVRRQGRPVDPAPYLG